MDPQLYPNTFPQADSLYYHIAKDALEKAQRATNSFEKAQSIVTAMVFASLCLEAFINQEYERLSETKEIYEDVERLSLETKWLLLPRLLGTGGTFDTGTEPFQTFKELIKVRNQRLVHFKYGKEVYSAHDTKSKDKPTYDKLVGDIERAERYVECIVQMIDKLKEITAGKTRESELLTGSKHLGESRAYLRGYFAAKLPEK